MGEVGEGADLEWKINSGFLGDGGTPKAFNPPILIAISLLLGLYCFILPEGHWEQGIYLVSYSLGWLIEKHSFQIVKNVILIKINEHVQVLCTSLYEETSRMTSFKKIWRMGQSMGKWR